MSSELRPAVEVFLDALIAWEDHSDFDYITSSSAAAAVIEADREAVRASLARAIIAWLDEIAREDGLPFDWKLMFKAKFGEK